MAAPLWSAFLLASERLPAKFFWRSVYDFIAATQSESFTLMNYGYAESDSDDASGEALPERLYRHVAGAVDLGGKSLLEVGSGRGGGLAHVKRALAPRVAFGVELSPRAVALARRLHRAVPGLSFLQGDAEALPFGDATFDAVLNVESSHCYPHRDRFFREVWRVLVPGGHFLYTDFFAVAEPTNEISAVRDLLAATPFHIEIEEDITDNVLRALRIDEARRLPLIERLPSFLQESFHNFAATTRSQNYQMLANGTRRYLRFRLRRD